MEEKEEVLKIGGSEHTVEERADLYLEHLRKINMRGGNNFLEINENKEVMLHRPGGQKQG